MTDMDYVEKKQPFILIIIMILTGVFGLIATDIYAPSLPLIPKLFATTTALAQLTVSIFFIGFAVTQLIAGMLSDSYGRKPILIVGLLIFFLGTLFCISAFSIGTLLLGRLIEGVGAGAIGVLCRILLKDVFSGVKMAQIGSYLAAFIGLSPAIAPVIGGFIQEHFGFRAIFIFLFLLAAFLFYFVIFHFAETNRFRHLHPFTISHALKKYKLVLSNSIFLANVVATGCALGVIIACAIINPFLLQNVLKMSPSRYGLCACIGMSGIFFGMISNGYLVAKFGIKKMMLAGMMIIFLGGLSFLLYSLLSILSVLVIVSSTFIVSLAAAWVLPNAIVGAFSPFPEVAGTVGAVYGCLQMIITGLVSVIIAMVGEPSQMILGLVILGLMIISGSIYYFFNIKKISDMDFSWGA